ncbi:M23 family metallopeptidase [Sinanaerobacter chloroacetimidivorans]|jgi:murein DD-endopeptidase MepM/ murein hydrolase activator NlpD|uniref:M23 family metallopeptidase n=1 Tax=Sinanaerobacter chloroacetimidivorans TaxID=2818044 RepID=A0A8J7W084_9FIRM|nr:M23 family metallopeptidase [Sinanaerobacter chloroacetimidivorans]MBR0597208.1 M23 family metallopeptidase [Sinanaerobacter chloroacetimidivorans]
MRLNNKRPNDRVAVALVLCFCVVAIASIYTMRSNLEQLDLNKNNDKINIAQDNQDKNGDQDVVKPVPTVDSTASKPDTEKQDANKQESIGNGTFAAPLQGNVTKGFSNDVPVYSKTLDQFIVHNGVDIEAPADSQVVSVADGTVTKVFTDDKLGITIEVSHGGGLVTKYSNLSTTKMVGEGDVVKKGQVISGVGNTALFESLESPHLHFEVWKDGAPVDPSEFIN